MPIPQSGAASHDIQNLAQILVRAAGLLAARLLILWPWLSSGRVGVLAFVLAAPFVLAGLLPRLLGPPIGKGLMVVATLAAFYEPPSSIAFSADRFALALPFFALALMLALPALSQPSPMPS